MKKKNDVSFFEKVLTIICVLLLGMGLWYTMCLVYDLCHKPEERRPHFRYESVVEYVVPDFYRGYCYEPGVIKNVEPCKSPANSAKFCYKVRTSYLDKKCPNDFWIQEEDLQKVFKAEYPRPALTIDDLCEGKDSEQCKQYYEKD